MAWAWIENGNIFVAYSKDVAPTDAIEVPEGTQPDELEWDGQNLRLKSQEQIQAEKLLKSKQEKLKQVSQSFEDTITNGHFFSQSLQIEVDCRRSDIKNDLQNVENLITFLTSTNTQAIEVYRGYTNPETSITQYAYNVTLEQLQQLKLEMIQYGLQLYNRKWQLEDAIANAQSQSELDAISIDFNNL